MIYASSLSQSFKALGLAFGFTYIWILLQQANLRKYTSAVNGSHSPLFTKNSKQP